ncbi:hypothetical protein MMC19_003472 [Ptychographa xylographoides]|nr:hypothetical protein [Ptychographa xylographoides]
MALVNRTPSTPTNPPQQAPQPLPVTPSPGTWRHPKFSEIARRQQAATFTDRNITRILWNAGALILTWPVGSYLTTNQTLQSWVLSPLTSTLGAWPWLSLSVHTLWTYAIPLLFLFNIVSALSPLFLSTDNISDIPLTPSQRSLLGLDPYATPPTNPGTTYVTPPRYPRSATPRSVSSTMGSARSGSGSGADSPLSRKGSAPGMKASGSPSFSPGASPLWQKAVGGVAGARRHSFALSSPFRPSGGGKHESILGVPSTPSPTAGRGASVGLNNRWLYERGRPGSGSRGVFS